MKNKKIKIKMPPPRNPIVVEMLQRNGGSHEKPHKTMRMKNKIILQKVDLDKI